MSTKERKYRVHQHKGGLGETTIEIDKALSVGELKALGFFPLEPQEDKELRENGKLIIQGDNKYTVITLMPELTVDLTIDYVGYSDCYNGHGHAFCSEELVACLPFSFSVDYSETVGEIKRRVMEELRGSDYDILDESLEEEIRALPDEVFEKAVENELEDFDEEDRYFSEDPIRDEEAAELSELPVLIGYFHVYKEE